MSTFLKTRAAAEYAAQRAPGELARARAAVLLTKLGACEDIPAHGDGEVTAALHGPLRDLVLAARDLAGPAWLRATSDDPDTAAFTAVQTAPAPPSPAELDEIISRVLWARFAPPATPDDGTSCPGLAPGPAAAHKPYAHEGRSSALLLRGRRSGIADVAASAHLTTLDQPLILASRGSRSEHRRPPRRHPST